MISALHERNIRIWRDISEEIETWNRTELNSKKKKEKKCVSYMYTHIQTYTQTHAYTGTHRWYSKLRLQ